MDPACSAAAADAMQRLSQLGAITDEPGMLTRWFLSPGMREVNSTMASWMSELGMTAEKDGWGNLIGRLPSANPSARVLLLGSHLDTVRNAGKYDGPLGVTIALAAVKILNARGVALPFHLDIAGFSDEEGLRFQAAYLGSRALIGKITSNDLELRDAEDLRLGDIVTPADALPKSHYKPDELMGYLEVHIEQGPVLEKLGKPLGLVTAINGQNRARLQFEGRADHAGTCPLPLRRDALTAAAEFILNAELMATEIEGLAATIGQLAIEPGASNVVPSIATLSLDVRHADDLIRQGAAEALEAQAGKIAERRGLGLVWETVQENAAVPCDPQLMEAWAQALPPDTPRLSSGAGHDAVILAQIAPIAMLFVRCKGGASHHPDESVAETDVAEALEALVAMIGQLAEQGGKADRP